ncbi:hypothetical protein CUJ84_Chr003258 [Rhizobium leguminosarum]|uniref:Uncharacterized protein n=1 Tax=Rhizobium leguminosarum TaxID=384 RepID=A0A2K9Z5R8_RHILE|nr:hypothetical protein CUJ84_Chr003258 [Rhizobium leguminosarum]
MPDEKPIESPILNYAADHLVTKTMNGGRSGAVHVYTLDEATSKFDYFARRFEQVFSGLKWDLPIERGSVGGARGQNLSDDNDACHNVERQFRNHDRANCRCHGHAEDHDN